MQLDRFGRLPPALPGSTLAATLPERVAKIYQRVVPIKLLQLPFEVARTPEVLTRLEGQDAAPAWVLSGNTGAAVTRPLKSSHWWFA